MWDRIHFETWVLSFEVRQMLASKDTSLQYVRCQVCQDLHGAKTIPLCLEEINGFVNNYLINIICIWQSLISLKVIGDWSEGNSAVLTAEVCFTHWMSLVCKCALGSSLFGHWGSKSSKIWHYVNNVHSGRFMLLIFVITGSCDSSFSTWRANRILIFWIIGSA